MGIINFLIIKMLVKTKFANIINISANKEIIPELLQFNCNARNIYSTVSNFLENPHKMRDQINRTQTIIKKLKTDSSSVEKASKSLVRFL